jgi:hypothetical protein
MNSFQEALAKYRSELVAEAEQTRAAIEKLNTEVRKAQVLLNMQHGAIEALKELASRTSEKPAETPSENGKSL